MYNPVLQDGNPQLYHAVISSREENGLPPWSLTLGQGGLLPAATRRGKLTLVAYASFSRRKGLIITESGKLLLITQEDPRSNPDPILSVFQEGVQARTIKSHSGVTLTMSVLHLGRYVHSYRDKQSSS